MIEITRGDVILVEFDPTKGSEIQKTRPAVVVSNNLVNKFTRLATVVPITSQKVDLVRSFEVLIEGNTGLDKKSKAIIIQVRSIDKLRIKKILGNCNKKTISKLDVSLKLHFSLNNF